MNNKKQLYEQIMSSVAKEVKKSLNEYRTKAQPVINKIDVNDIKKYLKMTPQKWLINKIQSIEGITNTFRDGWGNGGTLFVQLNNSIDLENGKEIRISITGRHIGKAYSVIDDLETICKYLQKHKEFKVASAKIRTLYRIEASYDINKDIELYNAIKEAKDKFNADVANTNTDEYAPTERDWAKMLEYMNGHSNPERVANSCKNKNKIVARCIIAKALGWNAAEAAFKEKIFAEHILSDAEFEAYSRKYANYNVPDDIKEMISDIAEYDSTGGIAAPHIEHSEILPDNVKKYIYSNKDIKTYTIELLDPIPLKRISRSRHVISYYAIGTVNLAKVIFTLIDGSEKETWFAYKYGECEFFNHQPTQAWKDEMGKGSHPIHNLKYIFGE